MRGCYGCRRSSGLVILVLPYRALTPTANTNVAASRPSPTRQRRSKVWDLRCHRLRDRIPSIEAAPGPAMNSVSMAAR
jgi:hypothetical protein